MMYSNEDIRRQGRLLDKEKAITMLKNGEYSVLSMQAENGSAYGIPLNYTWDENNAIYLHCAP